MLSIYKLNEEDVKTVLELLKQKPAESKYSYDTDDNIGFMSLIFSKARLSWQDRGVMCFFELTVGNERYDLSYPEGELHSALLLATKKEKERMKYGKPLREKLNIKINSESEKEEVPIIISPSKIKKLNFSYAVFLFYSIIIIATGIMIGLLLKIN